MAEPLGNDSKFQSALASATAKTVSSQLGSFPGLGTIVEPIIENATKSLSSDPAYPKAWAETLRRSHELTVVDPAANANDKGTLNLDVAPLLQLVLTKVSSGLGQQLKAPDQVLISLGTQNQRTVLVRLSELAPLGFWMAVGSVLAFGLSLLIARRRSTTLALIGLGGLVVVAGWKLLLTVVSQNLLNTQGGNQVADLFKQEYVSAATSNFDGWILIALITAGALLLIGLVGRVATRPRRALVLSPS
ncbi:hypothetical protein FHU41_001323 [Psychromicrobium silvestre]|uniref:Uncharacterized protein n=1 Tax=Psychromicrobium silvestre TaxID=1645614 RepID=A0A7Y9LT54_9MICC|nr:hypothetical protein [Psychromicrobium silvestre]NYE95102.1 hypothetical protein [Psychromicrobium silvestre]